MKKFLSLVLALVMTMSLVTISAGAVEYDDLTDKDEIQYEEAVTVLNRLGIITGYSEGDFRPKTELTRGAAAKIIVSLMIGPEAANNLVAPSAPYSDVPVDHTFAGVISYCKTSGYINGYNDGTFKPSGTLTGYAFSKMLLGALGYKGENEGGFTGAGWTMNVARLGNSSGLFNRISFKGNEAVTREQACQLALNTLKGTMVEYTGGLTITSGDATISGAATRTYVTSNQEYAQHINNRKIDQPGNAVDDHYTVEFGEEHFKDLRLDADGKELDAFGRPSSVWSYKKVTIGTFPLTPDFTFTTQLAYRDDASDAAKNRATGLGGYKIDKEGVNHDSEYADTTAIFVNGVAQDELPDPSKEAVVEKPADIADLTDNGTTVEVYIDQDVADAISHIVVIKTQLMEVKRVGSDYVSLQLYKDNKGLEGKNNGPDGESTRDYKGITAFNQDPIDTPVINVEDGDDCYAFLSGLKAGDAVAVIPVGTDHEDTEYTVAEAYTPETVSGALTAAKTYGKTGDLSGERTTTGVTVGGTEYKVALWNKDLKDINNDKIAVTRKDVTLYLDRDGNAMLAKDVGDSSDYMVLSYYYQTLVNGRLTWNAHGFDMSGNEVDLNVGPNGKVSTIVPGDLCKYVANATNANADWDLQAGSGARIYDVNRNYNGTEYNIKKSHTRIPLVDSGVPANYADSGIKFIYVNFNDDYSEVDSVQIVKGVQNVDFEELRDCAGGWESPVTDANPAEAYTNSDGGVKAVVIKNTTGTLSTNVLYIRNQTGREQVLSGKKYYQYEAAVVNGSDFQEQVTIWSDTSLRNGDFATWSEGTVEGLSGTYYNTRKLSVQQKTTSAVWADVIRVDEVGSGLIRMTGYEMDNDPATTNLTLDFDDEGMTVGNAANLLKVGNAKWLYQGPTKCPVTGHRETIDISSVKSLNDFLEHSTTDGHPSYSVTLRFVYNDNTESDDFRQAALVVVVATPTWTGAHTAALEAIAEPEFVDSEVNIPADDSDMSTAGLKAEASRKIPAKDPEDPAMEIDITETAEAAGDQDGKVPTGATVSYTNRDNSRVAESGTISVSADQIEQVVASVNSPEELGHWVKHENISTEEAFAALEGTVYQWTGETNPTSAILGTTGESATPGKGPGAAEAEPFEVVEEVILHKDAVVTPTYYKLKENAGSIQDGQAKWGEAAGIDSASAFAAAGDLYVALEGETVDLTKLDAAEAKLERATEFTAPANEVEAVTTYYTWVAPAAAVKTAGKWTVTLTKGQIDSATAEGKTLVITKVIISFGEPTPEA